jgi:hypothetical protein
MPPDDVAKDRSAVVMVVLKPIDEGIEALIIALVVDAMLQSQRWVGMAVGGKSRPSRVGEREVDQKLAKSSFPRY